MRQTVGLSALAFSFACFINPGNGAAQAVATFSTARALQAAQEACPGSPTSNEVKVRRNGDGSLVSIIREGKAETVLYRGGAQCNPLQEQIQDVWRSADGKVLAIVQLREEGRKLVIGDSEFRGFRYDIDPSGTFFILSQGNSSSVAAVERPFRKLLSIDLDAQRVFVRGRQIVVIGNGPSSGRLEYRILQPSDQGLSVVGQGNIGNQPAGVRVLDFDSRTGNVLLSGTNAAGQLGFVMVNLSTGAGQNITPSQPGDDQALFLPDASLRRALTGSSAAAAGSGGGLGGFRLPFFKK